MCERCEELDRKIERYRGIRSRSIDDAVITGATQLIEEAEAEKAALHPEQQE
jgi:hypothetical protein